KGTLTQRRIVREALNTHGLARNHIDNGSITRFQELGAIFQLFPRTTINLLLQFSKLAGNVSCVAIQHRWVIFAVTSHIATTNVFDRHVFDIKAHVVPRKGFTQSFMVHFNRLDFSCNIDWSKGDHHARFENTGLHSAHRDCTNT
uniref:Uncharacterized protein n=1 Tax=Sus scrofa TaxID=9823 RepID=A0A8D0N541_PIG